MKIIQTHNYYQHAGGEDAVVEAEASLLRSRGNVVIPYYKNNKALGIGLWVLGIASLKTIWNWQTYAEFRKLLQTEKPDIVHCHNTFPLISPSIYWACAKEGIPVVQTLHNYRLLCLNAFLFRQSNSVKCEDLSVKQDEDLEPKTEPRGCSIKPNHIKPNASAIGAVCELCLRKRFKWPGIKYRCYRESRTGSFIVATMLFIHKRIGTWSNKVTAYMALTEFQKQKMIEGGLPADKIFVKPNFIDGSSMREQSANSQQQAAHDFISSEFSVPSVVNNPYCLFVGRLSPEKGCDVLLRAWSLFITKLPASEATDNLCSANSGIYHDSLPTSNSQLATAPQLFIVGDGPERTTLEALTADLQTSNNKLQTIRFLGRKPKNEVLSLMHNAQFLISPSLCYETFGLVVLEAGMLKTPSIVAEPGTIAGLIDDGQTGLLFPMGDADKLAGKIAWAFEHPDEMINMGQQARQEFESTYAAELNYTRLMDIYESVLSG